MNQDNRNTEHTRYCIIMQYYCIILYNFCYFLNTMLIFNWRFIRNLTFLFKVLARALYIIFLCDYCTVVTVKILYLSKDCNQFLCRKMTGLMINTSTTSNITLKWNGRESEIHVIRFSFKALCFRPL